MNQINDFEQLRNWMDDKPRQVGKILSNRCTLRIMPLAVADQLKDNNSPTAFTLALFRANAILRIAGKNETSSQSRRALDRAVSGFRVVAKEIIDARKEAIERSVVIMRSFGPESSQSASEEARSIYQIAINADQNRIEFHIENSLNDASNGDFNSTAGRVQDAIATFRGTIDGKNASEYFWLSVEADMNAWDTKRDIQDLVSRPLWPDGKPVWWENAYETIDRQSFRSFLTRDPSNWTIWENWYADRLEGRTIEWRLPEAQDRRMDTWLIERPDTFWSRSAKDINADIIKKVASLRAGLTNDDTSEDNQANELVWPVASSITKLVDDAPVETEDRLERGPYALFLARRLHTIWCDLNTTGKKGKDSFILHIDAPWGGGKTSFANFVARVLSPGGEKIERGHFLHSSVNAAGGGDVRADRPYLGKPGDPDLGPWIIAHYNAWRDQYVKPPWWHILLTLQSAAINALRERPAQQKDGWFRNKWRICRVRWVVLRYILESSTSRMMKLHLGLMLILFPLLVLAKYPMPEPAWFANFAKQWWLGRVFQAIAFAPPQVMHFLDGFFADKAFPFAFLGLSGLTIKKGLEAFKQTLDPKLEFSAESRNIGVADPIGRFRRMFDDMLCIAGRPVLLIVDDIDRCDPASVVEIMRGFQTIVRSPRLFVVLLGDRTWIETAHNVQLKDMTRGDDDLGARFVQKVIQLSFRLPVMSENAEAEYMQDLLDNPGAKADPKQDTPAVLHAGGVPDVTPTPHDVTKQGEKPEGFVRFLLDRMSTAPTPEERQERIKAVVEASADTDHHEQKIRETLLSLFPRLPRNPRQMKRIVMAFSIYEAVGRVYFGYSPDAPPDGNETPLARRRWKQLARWVTLATEWPDYWRALAKLPDLLKLITDAVDGRPDEASLSDADKAVVAKIKADPVVSAILMESGDGSDSELDVNAIYEFNQLIWENGFATGARGITR